jgi:hypothetical protein
MSLLITSMDMSTDNDMGHIFSKINLQLISTEPINFAELQSFIQGYNRNTVRTTPAPVIEEPKKVEPIESKKDESQNEIKIISINNPIDTLEV